MVLEYLLTIYGIGVGLFIYQVYRIHKKLPKTKTVFNIKHFEDKPYKMIFPWKVYVVIVGGFAGFYLLLPTLLNCLYGFC